MHHTVIDSARPAPVGGLLGCSAALARAGDPRGERRTGAAPTFGRDICHGQIHSLGRCASGGM